MVSGAMTCVKYLLFGFNLVFFVAGLGLMICGALIQTKFNAYFDMFESHVNPAAILLLVVGFIILTVSFFGCCGAYKENHCMIMTFAVLLGLVFVLEVAAGVTAYYTRDQLKELLTDRMSLTTTKYGHSDGATVAWNRVQQEFDCCGAYNYTDWLVSGKTTLNTSVPDSCCVIETPGCANNINLQTDMTAIHEQLFHGGCVDKLIKWTIENAIVIGVAGIAVALFQIVGVLIACCLARELASGYKNVD